MTNQIPQDNFKRNKSWSVLFIVSVLLLVIVGGYLGYAKITITDKASTISNIDAIITNDNADTATSEKIEKEDPNIKKQRIMQVIYREKIREENGPEGKAYPVYKIWKSIQGEGAKVLVDEIGKSPEYFEEMIYIPNKNIAYANLGKRIVKLNLNDNKEQTIINSSNYILGITASQDLSKIFILDNISAIANRYVLQPIIIDVVTGESDNQFGKLSQLHQDIGFFPIAWRADNNIILAEPGGEVSSLWSYDLKNERITDLNIHSFALYLNIDETGTYYTDDDDRINDPCNGFSGDAAESLVIKDIFSGKQINKVNDSGKSLYPVTFASNKELIWSSSPIVSESECNEEQKVDYFTTSLDSGETRPLQQFPEYEVFSRTYADKLDIFEGIKSLVVDKNGNQIQINKVDIISVNFMDKQ